MTFYATLEEVLSADLILHVRDISHKNTKNQSFEVDKVLQNLGVSDNIPILEIWNKIDLVEPDKRKSLQNERYERQVFTKFKYICTNGIKNHFKQNRA